MWLFACVFPFMVEAQNLVRNGSFEEYTTCPGSFSRLPAEFRLPEWRSINTGSPDYFNACSDGEADVPYNWAGVSEAYDGNGYAGIYTWMDFGKEYREYLHCKLREPLVKDSVYHIEFRYKLSSYSRFCTDRIAILLSDSLAPRRNDRPLNLEPTFSFIKDSALTFETGDWERASADYRAKGNEQFLTIGNFSDNESTHIYHIRFRPDQQAMLANSAYYYIDDVKLIPRAPGHGDEPLLFAGEEPQLNTVYILSNIQFEFNSYTLKPVSWAELDKVVSYLRNHPDLFVRLSGHTDEIGSKEYNRLLSINRAKSTASYLISNGISPSRISTFGYGERQPLVKDNTEKARSINRRVEIEFYR